MNGTNSANGTPPGAKPLWKHSSPQTTPIYQFLQSVNKIHDLQLSNYSELHQWSISNINQFWRRAWEFVGVRHQGAPTLVSSRWPIFVASTYRR
jgi:acetoacetyl-CoA synthetase